MTNSLDLTTLTNQYGKVLSKLKSDIDSQAISILRRLKEAGFEAYLVGGGVRDLLVGLKPKDFDIATNALPNEVKKKVPYCFIIGRRFKLVHARRGDQIYEIATFRRAASMEELEQAEEDDRLFVEENFFGNIEEDSFRRDFTINSLFYDPIDEKIVDHCGGLQDIAHATLRMIGDPVERLKEDPVRILRAIRLSQKLNFTIEPTLRSAIHNLREELKLAVLPRRREEWLKFFRLPNPELSLYEMYDLGVLEISLPTLHHLFQNEQQREEFLCYIRQFKKIGFDESESTEIFSALLYSYLLTTRPEGFNPQHLEEDEKFLLFCKDELGVFKAEAGIFLQTLHVMHLLTRIDSYKKKGDRRQRALLSNPQFLLALKLGLLSSETSASDFIFWINEWEKLN